MASACVARHARLRRDGDHPPSGERHAAPKNDAPQGQALIRWSVQEIRRIATKLAQRRIRPAHIIVWSLWRRAHQATAQRAQLKLKMQL
jgi:hypothetical protein